jgi:hypothetical protein
MIVRKQKPGHYTVWVGAEYLVFRTERDAQRFCIASHYAKARSWESEEVQA